MRWPTRYVQLTPTGPGGGGGDDPDPTPDPPPVTSGATRGIRRHGTPANQIFNPACYLNAALPDDVAIDALTPAVVAELVTEAGNGARPALQSTKWSLPAFTVPADFPRVPVKMSTSPIPGYKLAMSQIMLDPGVPIPPEYVSQGDSDSECVIYSPDLDLAWEFWRLKPLSPAQDVTIVQSDGSSVTYPGVAWVATSIWQITNVSTHMGRSRNHNLGKYPNAPTDATKRLYYEDTNMSVAAARIPFLGTQLTLEDVERGLGADGTLTGVEPDHALNLSVIYPQKTTKRWPASTTDGFSTTSPLVEGMRFRFDPAVYTVAHINGLSVHPLCRLVIWHIVRRGIVIVDKSGSLEIDAEEDVHQYYDGTAPSSILDGFPWADLLLLVAGSDANPNPTS